MNSRFRWLRPLVLVALAACNETTDAETIKGPVGSGAEECIAYLSWASPATAACTACLHEQCAGVWQTMSQVCGSDPSVTCEADGGATTAAFCSCMTNVVQPCGRASGQVYACFVNECAKTCGADAGVGGAGGKGGSGGSSGKAGSGGSGGIKDAGKG